MKLKIFTLAIILISTLFFVVSCEGDASTGKTKRGDANESNAKREGDNGNNNRAVSEITWVAVGDKGTILTSEDALVWKPQTSTTRDILNAVHYGDNKWVAVGHKGTILTSTDALVWKPQTSTTTEILNDVHYGDNKWIAVGHKGTILTSEDALVWKPQTSTTTETLLAVHYGNNKWVAAGNASGTFPPTILIYDATNASWGKGAVATVNPEIRSLHYHNGQWIAGAYSGVVFSSSDATTRWTEVYKGTGNLTSMFVTSYNNGMWVLAGEGGTITSTDATDATKWETNKTDDITFSGLTYVNNKWVATVYRYDDAANTIGMILSSSNAKEWDIVKDNLAGLQSIAYKED